MYACIQFMYVCMCVLCVQAAMHARMENVCVCTRLYVCLTWFYMYIHLHIYGTPPELSTSFGVNPVNAGPDPLSPHLPTSLKDYSISMCTVCLQN